MFVIIQRRAWEGEERRAFVSPLYLSKMDATPVARGILLLLQSIVYRVSRKGARFPLQLIRYRVRKGKG